MARINSKITIRSVYFGMLLLSATVMISAVRLTVASDLDSLKAAAEQEIAEAQFNLGIMYADGRGVPQNDAGAVRLFRMAAEQGFAEAQLNLGGMHATQQCLRRDCQFGHPAALFQPARKNPGCPGRFSRARDLSKPSAAAARRDGNCTAGPRG